MLDDAGGPPARVLLLAADACDAGVADTFADAGVMPVLAGLRDRAAVVDTLAPRGLFVGATWPTVMTGLDADRHRYYTWLALDDDGYGTHQTTPLMMEGEPFWLRLDAAGRRCAVLDVPHSLAGRTPSGFGGVAVSEWGCHDRHVGPAAHPPQLLTELDALAGGPHYGSGPAPGFDQHAPCDYLHRAGRYRTDEESEALLAEVLVGHRRKRAASLGLLERGGWDLFLSVFAEAHCTGHQLWAQHDEGHPRHDPALRRRLGDPLEAVYREVDRTLGEHLERAGPDAVAYVLLSHGMGPHYDGTHLLDHLLLRFEEEATGTLHTGWRTRAAASLVDHAPAVLRDRLGPLAAPWLRRRIAAAPPAPPDPPVDDEGLLDLDRAGRAWFLIPNNTVSGAVRINVAGREPAGVVDPADYDEVCDRLARRLREVVDVDTGHRVVTEVVRVDRAMRRRDGDGLPDLLVEWDRTSLVERVWSPHVGTVVVPYTHWRTGDHHRGGRLFVVGPGVEPGRRRGPVSLAHVAPTVAAALGVPLDDVDGRPQPDLLPDPIPRAVGGADVIDPVEPIRRWRDARARRRALWARLGRVPDEVDQQAQAQAHQAGELALLGDAHHDTRLLADHAASVAGDALAEAHQLRPWIAALDERTGGEEQKAAVVHDHELRLERIERQLAVVWFGRLLAHTPVAEDVLVSVVLPTFDREALLPDAIASVQAQTYRRWELLVVDDGSTDGTADLLARYDDPRIRCFRTDRLGACGARNRALDEVRGDVVAYVDSDNRLDADWLKAVVWGFTTHPDEHALYGARVIDHPDRVYGPDAGPFPGLQFEPFDRAALEQGNFADMGVLAHRAGLGVRFEESLIWYGDWDLFLQLTADRPPLELPAVAVYYATGPADRLTPVAGAPLPAEVDEDRRRVLARHARDPR